MPNDKQEKMKYIHKCYTIDNKLLTSDNAAYVQWVAGSVFPRLPILRQHDLVVIGVIEEHQPVHLF
jgi:hypothetical protein